MNTTVGSSKDSAHTCWHCEAVEIERPSQQHVDEAKAGDTLPVVEINGLTVLLAASDGCTFSNWAVTEFDKDDNCTESDEISDGWSHT